MRCAIEKQFQAYWPVHGTPQPLLHKQHTLAFFIIRSCCTEVFLFVFFGCLLTSRSSLSLLLSLTSYPCHPLLPVYPHSPTSSLSSIQSSHQVAATPRYDGPLEYLTMWLCLFLSPAVCEPLQALEERNPKALSSLDIRPSMSAPKALAPHPLDMLRQLLKEPVP